MNENKQVTQDLDDEFFEAYANKMAEESNNKKSGTNYTPREYEDIGYAGCENGTNKIFRLIGAPPGAENTGYSRKNYDSKSIMMCEVKDDKGTKFQIRLPLREDLANKNHIIFRLYDKVTESAWIQKKKIFVNESKHPELWQAVTKTGFSVEKDGRSYTMATGLKASKLEIFNVIDRHDTWCKDNKHTKVLCRALNVDQQGRIWASPGVKSFGFINKLTDLINKYKNYEKYDIAIKRTGEQTNPFDLKNASIYKEKGLMEELKNDDGTLVDENVIVVGPLTDEERAYEKYDLDKLYQPTSYTKILNRLSSVFKLCDATLGTKFFDELQILSDKEKETWKQLYGTEDAETAETAQVEKETIAVKEELKEEVKPTTHRKSVVTSPVIELSDEKISYLKGWAKLSDHERALINDVIIKDGKVVSIDWVKNEETENLLSCDCEISSPESFTVCPHCGSNFI